MFHIILIAFVGFFIFYIIKNKIHVKWKTFLHKGFKKLDNKFRARGFHWKTTELARLILA